MANFRLFITDDDTKLVVSLLPPVVDGTSEHSTTGAITRIRPNLVRRPAYPNGPVETLPAQILIGTPRSGAAVGAVAVVVGAAATAAGLAYAAAAWVGLLVGATSALLGLGLALRRHLNVEQRWTAGHHVLTDREDQRAFRDAWSAVARVQRSWPALAAAVGLDDPSRTLAQALWNLAATLDQRGVLRQTRQQLTQARQRVHAASAAHAEIGDRLDRLAAAYQQVEASVQRERAHLSRLADEVDEFVREQQALARARSAIQEADEMMGALAVGRLPNNADTADLAERTAAVLTAYRELTGRPHTEP